MLTWVEGWHARRRRHLTLPEGYVREVKGKGEGIEDRGVAVRRAKRMENGSEGSMGCYL